MADGGQKMWGKTFRVGGSVARLCGTPRTSGWHVPESSKGVLSSWY
jgi:hypothetical protein